MKKILLSLGTIITVLTPIASVVACGEKAPNNQYEGTFSSDKNKNKFLNIRDDVSTKEFENEEKLTSLSLPDVHTIGDSAFHDSKLTSLSLPNVWDIGDDAFHDSKLTSLSLPKVMEIGDRSFFNSRLSSLSLPDTYQIGKSAFENSDLTSLSLPHVDEIGENAFGNSDITSLDIPEVDDIGDRAFVGSHLTSLTFGQNIRKIGDNAFYSANLDELYLKAPEIGEGAFANSHIKTLHLYYAKKIGNGAFQGMEDTYDTDIFIDGKFWDVDEQVRIFGKIMANAHFHNAFDSY